MIDPTTPAIISTINNVAITMTDRSNDAGNQQRRNHNDEENNVAITSSAFSFSSSSAFSFFGRRFLYALKSCLSHFRQTLDARQDRKTQRRKDDRSKDAGNHINNQQRRNHNDRSIQRRRQSTTLQSQRRRNEQNMPKTNTRTMSVIWAEECQHPKESPNFPRTWCISHCSTMKKLFLSFAVLK